jgi:hypothetical protein
MPNSSNSIGSYQIEQYEVVLPSGQTVIRKRIVYLDKNGEVITKEQYTEKPIDNNFIDNTDPTYAVNQITFTFDCSEDWNGCEAVTDRFIKRAGGNYTNITPFVAWIDCVLIGVSLSSREAQEWDAVIYVNGDEAVRLSSNGNRVASERYEHKISRNSEITVFVEGQDIQNPGIQLILTAVLPAKTSDKTETL